MRLTHLFALSGLAILAAQGMAQAYNIDPLTRRAYAPVVKPQAVAPAPTITASTNTSTNSGTFNDSVPIVARETVSFSGNYEPGTLVVSTSERRMYLVLENGKALRYGVGSAVPALNGVEKPRSPRNANGRIGHRLPKCSSVVPICHAT